MLVTCRATVTEHTEHRKIAECSLGLVLLVLLAGNDVVTFFSASFAELVEGSRELENLSSAEWNTKTSPNPHLWLRV